MKACSKSMDFDIPRIKQLAFKFLLLQKPLISLGLSREALSKNKKTSSDSVDDNAFYEPAASFFPDTQLPLKLRETLKEKQNFD